MSGACCERSTGSQRIISLFPEPLLTQLAFSEPHTATKGFFMMAFRLDLLSFAEMGLYFCERDFFVSPFEN